MGVLPARACLPAVCGRPGRVVADLLGVHVDNWGHPVLVLLVQLLLRLLLPVHTQKARQLRFAFDAAAVFLVCSSCLA